MRVPAIIFTAAMFAGTAHAGNIAGAGFGIVSCSGFSSSIQLGHRTEEAFFAWAQGYMTGWNTDRLSAGQSYRNMGAMTTKDQESFIRVYCSHHPEDRYMIAVTALLDALDNMPPAKVLEGSR